MKKQLFAAAIAAVMLTAAAPAFASSCPKHMKAIDAALASGTTADAMAVEKAKALRMSGEAAHKAGDHAKSMKDLTEAEKLLGIK